jgi:tRNA isopentenyl-2-thiomethyl-A-37 hydroxylase MiaE
LHTVSQDKNLYLASVVQTEFLQKPEIKYRHILRFVNHENIKGRNGANWGCIVAKNAANGSVRVSIPGIILDIYTVISVYVEILECERFRLLADFLTEH